MVRRVQIAACAFWLFLSIAYGGWVPLRQNVSSPAAPVVTLLQEDHNGAVLRVDVSGFEAKEFVAEGRTYESIDLLTEAYTTDVGYPELPIITKLLAVPDRADISAEVIEQGEEHVFAGYILPPARPAWTEGSPEPRYEPNPLAYLDDAVYPVNAVMADQPAIFRDFRIVRLTVHPVRYNAAKQELRVVSSLTIRVKYEPGSGANPKLTQRKPIAPSYAALYRAALFNYESALQREYGGSVTGRDVMLCIVPDAFYTNLLPFATWRNKTGIQVVVTKFSEIGATASNPDIIKNYIAQVYHTWEYPPTYILLAGGFGYVPIKQIAYDYTIVSENYYVEIDGNDFLPEIMIGRFTHKTTATEQVIVNKTVGYERTPYTADTSWFKKGVVASNDEYESALTTKRYTRDLLLLDGNFTQVDTFMNHSPCYSSLSTLISVLSNGRSFLNYRGEGWYTGWSASCYPFSTSNVSSVNNGRMLTFVTSIGCGVAAFNQTSCFGSAWLELGTVASPRGAVAFVGPTSNTHTSYNNKIDIGIYKGLFQEGLESPGQALARGRMLMYEVFGNQRWTEYQTRVYCILGDPSAYIWKDVPRAVAVTHSALIPGGYNQLVVTVTDSSTGVPVQGAYVCLSGGTVYSGAYTDAGGKARLTATPEASDTLSLLVRGGTVIPYEGLIIATSDTLHVSPHGAPSLVDLDGNLDGKINPNEHGQITFTLKNWGTQTASDVQATLEADTGIALVETVSPVSFGTISPGDSATGTPFQFYVKSSCPVGDTIRFTLHVTTGTRSWEYSCPIEVRGCKLKSLNFLVDDRTYPRPNSRLDPGETARLYITLKNSGDDIGPNVGAVLRSTSPYVTITDSQGNFGTLRIDSSTTNYADFFAVKVDSACPAGQRVPFQLAVRTESGLYPYTSIDTFSVRISTPKKGDPTGPDAYGYYAYGSDDTMHQQAPRFNWFEISSVGTRVTGSGGNYTATIALPFTFKYYGVNYTQLRISCDGWIAFGSGTQSAYTSYCLPRSDNVSQMVAVFWDDLIYTSSMDSQKILYYYHEPTQRFIVEWYYVGHNNQNIGQWNKETFQIILSNASTPTGDGELLMQYKTVAYPVECTVGLENHTQTTALQYLCSYEDYDESVSPIRNGFAILFTTRTPQLLVGVREPPHKDEQPPSEFALRQNYPNPFNPVTAIRYSLPVESKVTLRICNILGQEVSMVVNEVQSAGDKSIEWNSQSDGNIRVASGVYFMHLRAEGANGQVFSSVRKMVLLK